MIDHVSCIYIYIIYLSIYRNRYLSWYVRRLFPYFSRKTAAARRRWSVTSRWRENTSCLATTRRGFSQLSVTKMLGVAGHHWWAFLELVINEIQSTSLFFLCLKARWDERLAWRLFLCWFLLISTWQRGTWTKLADVLSLSGIPLVDMGWSTCFRLRWSVGPTSCSKCMVNTTWKFTCGLLYPDVLQRCPKWPQKFLNKNQVAENHFIPQNHMEVSWVCIQWTYDNIWLMNVDCGCSKSLAGLQGTLRGGLVHLCRAISCCPRSRDGEPSKCETDLGEYPTDLWDSLGRKMLYNFTLRTCGWTTHVEKSDSDCPKTYWSYWKSHSWDLNQGIAFHRLEPQLTLYKTHHF